VKRYLAVWRLPGAPILILFGIAGRYPISMVPLAVLLLVEASTGSYALAGIATGIYALSTAALAPVVGRLVDRRGPRQVLLIQGLVYPVFLTGLLAALELAAPMGAVYALCAASGAAFPVLSSSVRAIWSQIANGHEPVRQAAYALDSVTVEVVYVTGPVAVAGFVVIASTAAALAAAALLAFAGTIAVALSGPAARWRRHSPGGAAPRLNPLRAPGMPVLLGAAAGVMFGFGVMDVAVPAFAAARDAPAMAGVLLGVWAAGSVAGGLWFGTRTVRAPIARQWRWGLLGVSAGMAPLALAGNLWFLGGLLFVAGVSIAPMMSLQNGLVAELAPTGTLTEAFTWLTTVVFGASAFGTAVGGAVAEQPWGITGAFVLAASAPAAGWALASFAPRRPMDGAPRPLAVSTPATPELAAELRA
jgi:MFS family permease